MTNFTLKFGKYKGQEFLSTPTSYQSWLLKQDWFKIPTKQTPLHFQITMQVHLQHKPLNESPTFQDMGQPIP